MTKNQALELISSKIDNMQKEMIDCIDLIYNAGFSEAIEKAILIAKANPNNVVFHLEKLKV